MDSRFAIPSALEGTSLHAPLEDLFRIYGRIDEAQRAWIDATPYRCPAGCGACCEGFEPDISEIEALFLAAWLIRSKKEELLDAAEAARGRTGCVLADPSGQFHCTAYGGRPLVCRLFAYAGDRGKDGAPRFRTCSRQEPREERSLDERTLRNRFGSLPPLMGDYAGEAELILPNSAGDRVPLRDALPAAVAKIRYLIDLNDFSGPKSA